MNPGFDISLSVLRPAGTLCDDGVIIEKPYSASMPFAGWRGNDICASHWFDNSSPRLTVWDAIEPSAWTGD
jgi:hypothetical protein